MRNHAASYGLPSHNCVCSRCSGVREDQGIDWIRRFKMLARLANHGARLQTPPLSLRMPATFASTIRSRAPQSGLSEAARPAGGPVEPLRGHLRRRVSHAQLIRPDTPQVPETRGVQCCLAHNTPCRTGRVRWCDCDPLPFLSPCYDLFPLIPFHWQQSCCCAVSLFLLFVPSFGSGALVSFSLESFSFFILTYTNR
jgi:hypothetical protein